MHSTVERMFTFKIKRGEIFHDTIILSKQLFSAENLCGLGVA